MTDWPILEQAKSIAWDIDGTLLGHVNSMSLWMFIHRTPEKEHHVITFRGKYWAMKLESELPLMAPDISQFLSINHLPTHLEVERLNIETRRNNRLGFNPQDEKKFQEEYYCWKGKTAKALGCDVLVDDMHDHTKMGCDLHGIALVHPDNLP